MQDQKNLKKIEYSPNGWGIVFSIFLQTAVGVATNSVAFGAAAYFVAQIYLNRDWFSSKAVETHY